MAVSRPLLLALIGALLAVAGFYATSGARNSAEDAGTPEPAAPERGSAKVKRASPSGTKGAEAGARRRGGADGRSRAAPKPEPPRAVTARTGMPAGVTRALARKRTVVVLFFFQRGSADDAATARAVASLRGRGGVRVFTAPISRLGDYQAVIGAAGVSRAPAVVVVGRDRAARLIEGFVDSETLAQHVADAR